MLESQLTGWFSPLLLFNTAVVFMLEKSLWFSWILKRQALRFCKAIFAFSRPASKNVHGFFSSVCVSLWILFTFIKHGPAHYSVFIIASGPHWRTCSVWKQTKQTLQESKGQFWRGYGNMASVATKMSCGPKLGLLLFRHLFIICQSHVSTS